MTSARGSASFRFLSPGRRLKAYCGTLAYEKTSVLIAGSEVAILFIGFIATMSESDFSGSCISGFGSSPSRYGPSGHKRPMADPEISRFPRKERPYMPGSKTTPGLAGARNDAPASVAFRGVNNVGTRVYNAFAAQWLAYTLPYRRFAVILAEGCARIGGDVGC